MSRVVLLASVACLATVSAVSAQTIPEPAKPIELEPIVVTANRTDTPAKEVGSAVTVITREELEQKQIRLVSDALRSMPGVAVNRVGPAGGLTQVRIRGSEGNQTLVLIDGMEVNDPAGGSEFNFAHLLAQDIDRIEVLRGPQSALYGSDAIGGVINIITRRGDGPPRGSVFVEAGSRGTVEGGGSISGSTDRVDYLIGGVGLRTDGFSAASEWRGNTEKDGYDNGTVFGKFGFQATDNLRFDVVGRAVDYYSEGDDEAFGSGAYDFKNDVDGDEFYGRAQAKLDLFEGRWQQIVGALRTGHSYDYLYDSFPPTKFDGLKTKFDYQSNVFAETGELSHTFTFAADHEKDEATTESSFSSFDKSLEQTGLVGEYKLGAWDQFFVTGSVRHDFNDGFEDATTFRITSAYIVEQTGTKLRASYGTGVKNPTLFELYGQTPTFIPNPNLKPEGAKGWDVGFDQPVFGNDLVVNVTYFDQRIDDLIQLQGLTVVNLPGESKIHGVEFGLSATPIDNLTLRASYTWLQGEDAQGVELIRRPSNSASFDANYAFLDGRANVNLGVVYNGTQDDLPFWRPVVELDDFVLVNLRGGYKIDEHTEVYARVENLLDEEYEEVYTFGGTGRTAIAGVRVSF
ncbi:TonB-dependent receptor plug domain-containing protein [Flaviflagellibacter deserti]|uniref:TonB-dependent receptor plug domain-containing protein n=1 Tax=Flaviflagellibacter deserti TaxID=2267266 RepID=A0ABV9Z7L7_9HYPH